LVLSYGVVRKRKEEEEGKERRRQKAGQYKKNIV
jgi:hypothetical protein